MKIKFSLPLHQNFLVAKWIFCGLPCNIACAYKQTHMHTHMRAHTHTHTHTSTCGFVMREQHNAVAGTKLGLVHIDGGKHGLQQHLQKSGGEGGREEERWSMQ